MIRFTLAKDQKFNTDGTVKRIQDTRQISSYFNFLSQYLTIIVELHLFCKNVKLCIFVLFSFAELAEQFQVHNLLQNTLINKELVVKFWLFEESMNLSCILCVVQHSRNSHKWKPGPKELCQ